MLMDASRRCVRCLQRTLPCVRTGCQGFARGFLVPGPLKIDMAWSEASCLLCQVSADAFPLVSPFDLADLTRLAGNPGSDHRLGEWCADTQGGWVVLLVL